MTVLFYEEYYGEGLFDLCRDISECIDPDFNDKAKKIDHNSSVHVSFIYIFEDESQKELLKSTYSLENLQDIEDDVFYSVEKVNNQKDKHGFHPGGFKLSITLA